jgi:hypothetical protein
MAISITQTPATASLAQSPIIFTVVESNPVLLTSSSFQYIGELYYWTGSVIDSGSVDYTITKFPNTATVGIFDLNRIINSTLTELAATNPSNVMYFAVYFYTQYLNGTLFVTGSHVKSNLYKALDGYGVFPEPIGQEVYSKTIHWPLITDGPTTQSALITNNTYGSIYTGNVGTTQPTKIVYTSNITSADYFVSSSTNSGGQEYSYPVGPSASTFPLSTVGLEWFSVQPYASSTAIGTPIRFEVVCNQKYPNV